MYYDIKCSFWSTQTTVFLSAVLNFRFFSTIISYYLQKMARKKALYLEGFEHPMIIQLDDSQEPQSMQVSLISYLSSPSLIAPTGHTEAQEPHLIHSSPITLIIGHLHKIYRIISELSFF